MSREAVMWSGVGAWRVSVVEGAVVEEGGEG